MNTIDLHFHSLCSDGKLPVSDLADLIRKSRLDYCALTDHDSVAGITELQQLLAGSETILIPVTELTVRYGVGEIHMLAYSFDIDVMEQVLAERNILVQQQKVLEMEKSISLFREVGIEVDTEIVPEEKKPVGYTLSVAVCKNEKNQELFIGRHGKRLERDDIYFEYQAPGKSCAVERSGVTLQWLLSKIKDVVGDLIVAHPFVAPSIVMKPLGQEDILKILELGATGVEIYHDDTTPEQIKWLEKIVQENNLSYTGGSDFHGAKGDLPLGCYGVNMRVPSFKLSGLHSM
jgi:predicted metal-dependent phosphoesterase TrpH